MEKYNLMEDENLGKLKYFLGIEVVDIAGGVCLTQRKYCLELLHEFESDLDDKIDMVLENITEFQNLVGKLIYLTITRPDISYYVQLLSQCMHKPRKSHLAIAMRLLRYFKNSPGKGNFVLKTNSLSLVGYFDGDWAKCLFTNKSVSGYLVFFGNTLVSWKSKKQNIISRSSIESEYRALVLTELNINNIVPIDVMCDNESAIKLALNPIAGKRPEPPSTVGNRRRSRKRRIRPPQSESSTPFEPPHSRDQTPTKSKAGRRRNRARRRHSHRRSPPSPNRPLDFEQIGTNHVEFGGETKPESRFEDPGRFGRTPGARPNASRHRSERGRATSPSAEPDFHQTNSYELTNLCVDTFKTHTISEYEDDTRLMMRI
ncbi:hypothetical protein LXL04_023904 [Taraxacum kok-saghyz]